MPCVCVCEEDAIIIIVLGERTREICLISSFSLFLDCLWSLDARAHVYDKQDSMYVSKMCVCGEKKKKPRRNFLYHDRMSMVEGKMDCVCVRKRKIISIWRKQVLEWNDDNWWEIDWEQRGFQPSSQHYFTKGIREWHFFLINQLIKQFDLYLWSSS